MAAPIPEVEPVTRATGDVVFKETDIKCGVFGVAGTVRMTL